MSHEDQVIETIKSLYAALPKPILLSTLGYELRKKGCAVSGGTKKFIEEHVDGFTTIQHPTIHERIAISSSEDVAFTKAKIENSDPEEPGSENINSILGSIHRSVLFAFCSNNEIDSYLSIVPPFKFRTDNPEDETNFRKIKKEEKLDILIPANINKMNRIDAEKLLNTITTWCNNNDININLLLKQKNAKDKKDAKAKYREFLPPILIKFIDCQPEEVKKKLVIPFDLFM